MNLDYVIKHPSGWYYKEDRKESMINQFSVMDRNLATKFSSRRAALDFIDEHLQEFNQGIPSSLLEIECVD